MDVCVQRRNVNWTENMDSGSKTKNGLFYS